MPAFTLALVDLFEYSNQFPGCDFFRADSNGDFALDGRDVEGFVALILE